MTDDSTIPPLRSVNGYEILDLIAVGGMSRVYRASAADGAIVAVKVIQFDEMAADYERRLRREPEIQRGIGHANIVGLIDWFRVGGEFFLVMEFVDGRSLWRIIHEETGALPFERARNYLRSVIGAVMHLHELGIIHRDIKPANVLVAQDDTTKLADFGIAKFTWQQGQTRTQLGLGTPEYMSPEQARGIGIDHRTDIYSLGISFFEMLTGYPPFVRNRATPAAYSEIIQGILSQDVPDPRTIRPDVPGGAAEFIATATMKDPKDRFATAGLMLRALDAIEAIDNSPGTVIPRVAGDSGHASRSFFKRRPFAIAVLIVLLIGTVFAASRLFKPGALNSDSTDVAVRDMPVDIARRIASSYRVYSRAHSLEPLAAMYAPDHVKYFGDGVLTRDSILGELRADYTGVARTDSFAVDVDSARAVGDTAVDIAWRASYARVRSDSSHYTGTTRENVRLTRVGAAWMITEHSRRTITGIAPDGVRPRVAVKRAPVRSSRTPTARTAPKRIRPPVISVRIDRDGDEGRGKGTARAKKRRNR